MGQLAGHVVVITGANRGIGKRVAEVFAEQGARIAICARDAVKLDAVAAELRSRGAEVLHRMADVTDEQAVSDLFDAIIERFGRLDILVNNAGAFDSGRLDELTLKAWNNVIGACLTGAFLCSRAAFRIMKQQGGGRILNIGSISAQRPRDNSAPYASAKAGLWGLTQATAIDGRPFGIVCGCLHPGNVRVGRSEHAGRFLENEPEMDPDTIARAALAMVTVPPDVNFLEAIVLPRDQLYLGRG
jgi:NAD(P)-dependent dehydrogenase (short-subunit alcohol dehydrogenase family)